ncbi:MAG: ComEC family competence protein [Chitinophagales bacterium]|nr:ComEC family competence protein [Chitinophagales bacterium]
MSLRALPFVRLLAPFLLGIFLYAWAELPFPPFLWPFFLLYTLALPLILLYRYAWRYRWVAGVLLGGWLLLLGWSRATLHDERRQAGHFSHHLNGQAQWFSGWVYESPGGGTFEKIPLRVDSIDGQAVCGNLLLFVRPDSLYQSPRYGEHLRARVRVLPVQGPQNPDAFDYRRFLHFKNIHYQAFVQPDTLIRAQGNSGTWYWHAAYYCRDQALATLARHFPEEDEYAVASALLLGYKEDLSDELQTAYVNTGSMHALAVSGSHVGMLYAGLLFGLGWLQGRGKRGRWGATLLILAAIWAFTFITGATASVLRASLMFSIFLLGKNLFWREVSVWNVLATSAMLLLWNDPFLLFDAGFQLSYAAVAGMVFFYPRFFRLSPIFKNRIVEEAWKALLLGCAAQLGTLPLALYYFHQFPLYFWLSGWVVMLGGALFMAGGAALIALDWCWPAAAAYLGKALGYMLWGLNWLIRNISKLPGSTLDGIWLNEWAAWLLALALVCGAAAFALRRKRWYWAGMSLLLVLGVARLRRTLDQREQAGLTVYAISKHSLVDIFEGQTVYTFPSTANDKQLRFAAQQHRWAMGARRQIIQDPKQHFSGKKVSMEGAFIKIKDKKVLWINGQMPLPDSLNLPLHALLLSNNPEIELEKILRECRIGIVVFDRSNTRKNCRNWTEICLKMGVPSHDIAEKGAFCLQ